MIIACYFPTVTSSARVLVLASTSPLWARCAVDAWPQKEQTASSNEQATQWQAHTRRRDAFGIRPSLVSHCAHGGKDESARCHSHRGRISTLYSQANQMINGEYQHVPHAIVASFASEKNAHRKAVFARRASLCVVRCVCLARSASLVVPPPLCSPSAPSLCMPQWEQRRDSAVSRQKRDVTATAHCDGQHSVTTDAQTHTTHHLLVSAPLPIFAGTVGLCFAPALPHSALPVV